MPTLVSSAILAALLAPAVRAQEAPGAAPPSIVLVTIDTLRREHLGCYGYPRPTSPRVDALAKESLVFEHAFAPMATTFPSHLSLLTGLYPHQHGHTSNQGAVLLPYRSESGHVSFAAALASAGYGTAGFVSSVVLSERTGIGAGFETYDAPKVKEGKRPARETMDRALAWLAAAPAERPFFLWVHLWDVHEPNTPEPQFAALLAPDDTLRQWVAARHLDPAALAGLFAGQRNVGERFFALAPEAGPETDKPAGPRGPRPGPRQKPAGPADFTIDEEALVALHARYDACIRQVDEQVGRLIDALAARGTWAHTAFVFTGDHGQSLGENLHLGHGANTQVNVSVPLVIHFPALTVPAGRTPRLWSHVDLVPTLLGALHVPGLESFRSQLAGADLTAPGFARDHVLTAEATEFHRGAKRPYDCAVLTERWKYARAEGSPGRLYDLAGAGEQVDVAATNAAVARELDLLLTSELASSKLSAEGAEPVNPETEALLKKLKNLGYGGDEDE